MICLSGRSGRVTSVTMPSASSGIGAAIAAQLRNGGPKFPSRAKALATCFMLG